MESRKARELKQYTFQVKEKRAGARISTQHKTLSLGLIVVALLSCHSISTVLCGPRNFIRTLSGSAQFGKTEFTLQEAYQNLTDKLALLESQLNSGLNAIRKTVSANQIDIRALISGRGSLSIPRSLTNITQRSTIAIAPTNNRQPTALNHGNTTLGCGGRIPMYAVGESKLLAYKNNQQYGNDERCLWTIDNEAKTIRKKLTLKIKLLKNGFADKHDSLYALKFNRESGLASQKIELGQEYTFSEDQLYLSFTSDHSVTGTGFVIQLNVTESVENGRGWTTYRSSSPGEVAVGAYADHDLINFVIDPKTTITFAVNYVHTRSHSRCNYDRLMVWEIGRVGNIGEKARLCGDIWTTSSSFETPDPVLVLFTADGTSSRPPNAGFKVSWR